MDCETFKENERKILTHLLTQLDKRIYLLRVSLYDATNKCFPDEAIFTKKMLEMEDDEFQEKYGLPPDDYRLVVDSCEIETSIRRILDEITMDNRCTSLKDIVQEMDEESTSFKRHQEMKEDARKQIEQLRGVLSVVQEQAKVAVECLRKQLGEKESSADEADSSRQIDFLRKLMEYKVESKKHFYEHQKDELQRSIEWYERETRIQEHADIQTVSFWLLKLDNYTEKLDRFLKEMFDTWATKRRELGILKKYRKFNQEKIQKLQKLIAERDDYIEKDRQEKEERQKQREIELRRQNAAVIIQAFWRETMKRKQLGPYKVKKPKKGKGKKGKGKGKGKGKEKK